jgi:Tfp pilus assembly protein PilO
LKRPVFWNLPAAQWARFGLCLVVILAFGALMIWPQVRQDRELARRAARLREEIRTQEMLFPLYQAHLSEMRRLKALRALPVPDSRAFRPPPVRETLAEIRQLILAGGFDGVRLAPDMARLNEDAGRLALDVQMNGPFHSVRDIFLALGRLPYVLRFERLEIRKAPEGEEIIQFRVWLRRP